MGRHALRGAISAWLGLILLEAVVRPGGAADSGRFGGFVNDVTGLVNRALSAKVPAIPDRRAGAAAAADSSQQGYITPAQAAAAARAAAALPAVAAVGHIAGPSLGQYVAGGGLAGIGANPALNPALYPTTPAAAPGRVPN